MSLRFLVVLIVVALCTPAGAQQPKKVPTIGYVTGGSRSSVTEEAFRQGLRELGYVDGSNILIESRYAEGKLDRMPALVNELVQQKVDIICVTNNVAIVAAKQRTKTIPIVMVSSVDPVVAGYVDSLAHPGGNVTGLATVSRELSAKRIELIKELIPHVSRIAMLWDVEGPGPIVSSKEYQEAAQRFKLQIQSLELRSPTPDIEGVFRAARRERAEGLIKSPDPAACAANHRACQYKPTSHNERRY
jgi:putative tryptophan/tyrosine transport system substrate-binding protein